MRNEFEFSAEILDEALSGFHRYQLTGQPCLNYVSGSLCEMVGCSARMLMDGYEELVHPADRIAFREFLAALSAEERRMSLRYRLICSDGRLLDVLDTTVSRRDAQGVMQGYSTLAELGGELDGLRELGESLPCGILRYTCTETPRVTYINDRMLRMLRYPEQDSGAAGLVEQYMQNVYLLIPPEERLRFKRFQGRVYEQDKPVVGEITVMRLDGTRIRLDSWMTKGVNSDGVEEFRCACMDVTDRYDQKRRLEEQSYLRALSQVYDEISELDFSRKTIRFLQGHYFNRLGRIARTPMALEEAVENWIDESVVEEDRPNVREAFRLARKNAMCDSEDAPIQTEFSVRFSDGALRSYIGIFLKMKATDYLFCCRNVTHQREADALKTENTELRNMTDQMKTLVMRFTDGMLAFEIRGDCVRPLFISENACHFFGYGREEWLESMNTLTPVRDFISKCHISYEDYLELLENREVEFHYTDVVTHKTGRIRAISTASADDGEDHCYVMLCVVTDRERQAASEGQSNLPEVYIRTFGYFDVFINGNPIAFRNEKAKELFALLVDRRGGFVTSGEAISLLWEDEPANSVTLARYRKVALRLKNTLEEYGIAGIVESVDGKRRIVSQLVRCDLFEYLSGEAQHAQLFKGNYLQNYSWGETTLAELSAWNQP